jgi:hypothetical protein
MVRIGNNLIHPKELSRDSKVFRRDSKVFGRVLPAINNYLIPEKELEL